MRYVHEGMDGHLTINQAPWHNPFLSARQPIAGRNVVATSHPLAAQAALDTLSRGGNAAEATIAGAAVLAVVEPQSSGLGGDALAILWDGDSVKGLNGSGRAPAALDAEEWLGSADGMPLFDWPSVTVPGVVATWSSLYERYGRLPFASLFERAIQYAAGGFVVLPTTASSLELASSWYGHVPEFARTFLSSGRAPRAGDRLVQADCAQSLQLIAQSRGSDFYQGEIAARIAEYAYECGAVLSEQDLRDHKSEWVQPLSTVVDGQTVYQLPPNTQGVATLATLGILSELRKVFPKATGVDYTHLQIEATNLALADCSNVVGDGADSRLGAQELLTPEYFQRQAQRVSLVEAKDYGYRPPHGSGTVCLTVADASGFVVSYMQSLYIGSGVVVPGTGVHLHNRGSAFSTIRGHVNEVAPSKRPLNSNMPGLVLQGQEPRLAIAILGGPMQPQGQVQLLDRVLQQGMNVQAAVDAPRWRAEGGRDVSLEPSLVLEQGPSLSQRGHAITDVGPGGFGSAQMIERSGPEYVGGSDTRRDGQAVGF